MPVTVETHEPKIDFFNITADPIIPGKPFSFTLSWQLEYVKEFQITADDGPGGQQRTLPVPDNYTSYSVMPTQPETTYTLLVLTPETSATTKGEIMQTKDSNIGAEPSAQTTAVIIIAGACGIAAVRTSSPVEGFDSPCNVE